MVRIVKNKLGGSAIQQELRRWGLGVYTGMNRGTGGGPPPPRQFEPLPISLNHFASEINAHSACFRSFCVLCAF